MRRGKHVERMLAKAAQDEYVLDRLLPDETAPDEVFGFHAQQAVEKLLKAALSAAGVRYPRTHRIAELLDLLEAAEMRAPPPFDELRRLTPFAVAFRYDVGPEDDEAALDKPGIRRSIVDLRQWVEQIIAAPDGGGDPPSP